MHVVAPVPLELPTGQGEQTLLLGDAAYVLEVQTEHVSVAPRPEDA